MHTILQQLSKTKFKFQKEFKQIIFNDGKPSLV